MKRWRTPQQLRGHFSRLSFGRPLVSSTLLLLCRENSPVNVWPSPARIMGVGRNQEKEETRGNADFLALDLAPRFHSWSSTAAFFAFSVAALALAASAFCRGFLLLVRKRRAADCLFAKWVQDLP